MNLIPLDDYRILQKTAADISFDEAVADVIKIASEAVVVLKILYQNTDLTTIFMDLMKRGESRGLFPTATKDLGDWINQNHSSALRSFLNLDSQAKGEVNDFYRRGTKLFNADPDQRDEIEDRLTKDLRKAKDSLRDYVTFLGDLVEDMKELYTQVAPKQFQFKGFRVFNPDGLPEDTAFALLDGVSYALALFKKRGLEDLIEEGIDSIVLGLDRPGLFGLYNGQTRELSLFVEALRGKGPSNQMMKNFVHEVFLHEFGHYIDLNYLTQEANAFWNGTWAPVQDAQQAVLEEFIVSQRDREQFVALLKRDSIGKTWKKLQGADRLRFVSWLDESGAIERTYPIVETEFGSQAAAFLQHPTFVAENLLLRTGQVTRGELTGGRAHALIENTVERLQETFDEGMGVGAYARGTQKINPELTQFLMQNDADIRQTLLEVFSASGEIREAWKDVTQEWGSPTEYAKTSPQEDFAESFVLFMISPQRMTENNRFRMKRTLWLSGFGGKPVMRLAKDNLLPLSEFRALVASDVSDLKEILEDLRSLRYGVNTFHYTKMNKEAFEFVRKWRYKDNVIHNPLVQLQIEELKDKHAGFAHSWRKLR